MSAVEPYSLRPVGVVRSPLKRREDAPKQGCEGGPEAWLDIDPAFADALDGITCGAQVLIFTWLHVGRRDVLKVRPRHRAENPLMGVFATRSPDRPNPIGLHRVTVLHIDRGRALKIAPLEAIDGTPVIDIKPVLDAESS
jgi:tRNA-Thr(GGU) m(6)t(6)A37 methyltransferase TsaA